MNPLREYNASITRRQFFSRFTDIVGADRVIAGTDCGFGTFAGFGAVDPEIAYAKLASLADGAALASNPP